MLADDMTELKDRLREARKRAKKTQAQVAEAVGMKQPSYHQLESGKSGASVFLPKIAHYLEVDVRWLEEGQGVQFSEQVQSPIRSESDDLSRPPLQAQIQLIPAKRLIPKIRYVPIKGSAKMGPDGYFNSPDGFAVEDGDGYVQSIAGGPNSYALRGTGGSMFPAIRDGWFVVCEPDTNPIAGEFVLVCINHERCIIKEYITQRDGLLHLLSVNSGERMALEMADVTAIVPIIEIMPPSRRVLDRPVFDV